MTRGTITNKQTGPETQDSRAGIARYAVGNTIGQFAWFMTEADASEFISLQPFPEGHWIVELTRG